MKDKKLLAARIVMTLLTVTAVAAIFYNSSLSAVASTEQSMPLTVWINRVLCSLHFPFCVTEGFIRKLAHFTEYTILGVMMSVTLYLYLRKRVRMLIAALPLGAAVAVCDELIQRTAAGRSCQVSDMILDFCGIVFGALIVTAVISLLIKRRKKKSTLISE